MRRIKSPAWIAIAMLSLLTFGVKPEIAETQFAVIEPMNSVTTGENQVPAYGPMPEEPITAIARGYFEFSATDLYLPGPMPIFLTRTYRSMDRNTNLDFTGSAFGMAMHWNYGLQLFSPSYAAGNGWTKMDLIMPDGARVVCGRTNQCSKAGCADWQDAIFACTQNQGDFFASAISYNNNPSSPGWNLMRKDGTDYFFPLAEPLGSITDRYGNSVSILYNSAGNPTEVLGSDGRYIAFTYRDSSNPDLITQATDESGRSVSYTYDSSNRMSDSINPVGVETTYAYSTVSGWQGDIVSAQEFHISTEVGAGTVSYSSIGRVSAVTGMFGNYSFTYNSGLQAEGIANWCQMADPNGHIEKLSFDSVGYVDLDQRAYGLPEEEDTTYSVDTNTSLVDSRTDQLGRVTAFVYDSNGNIASITQLSGTPNAVTTSFTYDPNFSVVSSVTDPLGHTMILMPDSSGSIVSRTDPLGNAYSAAYNAQGQETSITDPMGLTTSFAYNAAGDLTSVVDPLGNSYLFGYDAAGRMISMTDPLGNTSNATYDAVNRVSSVTDPLGETINFLYADEENLTRITDADGNQTNFSINPQTNSITTCDPAGRCRTAVYDLVGNLIQITDGRGIIDSFTYDGLNRMANASFNVGTANDKTGVAGFNQTETTFTYDGGDRLLEALDSGAGSLADTITMTYDGVDDLLSSYYASANLNANVSYTYDNDGRRTSMTAANQAQTTYTYDADDRPTSETRGSLEVALGYDKDSRRTSLGLPNGVTVVDGYDNDSRLTSLSYSSAGGGNLGNLAYGYDNAGRLTSIGGSLASAALPAAMTATYDASNQLLTYNGATALSDGNGNLTYDPTLNATYTWNERNQLLTATTGTAQNSFSYDAFSRRVALTSYGLTTRYVYDGLNIAQEQYASSTADMMLGLNLDEYFSRIDSSGNYAMLGEMFGSVAGLVNSTGALVTQYQYSPYGATTMTGASSTNPFQFLGRELDPTGLYELRARYYNPVLSRFISPDPIGFADGQANLLEYSFDAPTDYFDPLGLQGCGSGLGNISTNQAVNDPKSHQRNKNLTSGCQGGCHVGHAGGGGHGLQIHLKLPITFPPTPSADQSTLLSAGGDSIYLAPYLLADSQPIVSPFQGFWHARCTAQPFPGLQAFPAFPALAWVSPYVPAEFLILSEPTIGTMVP